MKTIRQINTIGWNQSRSSEIWKQKQIQENGADVFEECLTKNCNNLMGEFLDNWLTKKSEKHA